MTDKNSLMEFPCHFPIKIIGKNHPEFATDIDVILRKHFPTTPADAITSQLSLQGNYLAITITVHAHNQASLDALYHELTQHPDIKMVL
jgi:hypothetical protein